MLLKRIADTSLALAETAARNDKVALISDLLGDAAPIDAGLAVGYLTASPRQGNIGIGWRQLADLEVAPASEATLTLIAVDEALSDLAAITGTGSRSRRRERLERLFELATASEQEFLRHVLLGEIRHGALDGIATAAVAKACGVTQTLVRRAAMLSGDLARTAAAAAEGGEERLRSIGLTTGVAVQPMLASTSQSVADAIADLGELARVEWKLDGIRVQVHKVDDTILVFSRNLNDITDQLPGVVDRCRAFEARRFILDGEALRIGDDGRPAAFQDTMADGEASLRPYLFDILHLDGSDLIDEPLRERHDALASLVGEDVMPGAWTADADDAQRVFDEAVAIGHEGCVVKLASSTYAAGRRGKTWRKVKPVHTFDLVVLAAEWGHGRRTGSLSNLHLGARHGSELVMVGKTFKGLTDDLLRWQTEQLLARETSTDGHVVHVRPELVVEVAIDGVQRSPRYPGAIALRFARVRRYRADKTASDVDSLTSLQALLP